jgi:cytochrome d ubiquinol oxidase subunit II
MPGTAWRSGWDWALFVGGAVPSLVFGVAMGNLLRGVPYTYDSELRATYAFGLFDLLNPFAIACGLVSVAMLVTHGAVYLSVKTDDVIARRARTVSRYAGLAWFSLFALTGLWLWKSGYGLVVTSGALPGAEPDPLAKTATWLAGAWLANYGRWPATMIVPAIGLIAPLLISAMAGIRQRLVVFVISSLGIAGVIGSMGVSLFPFLLPSSSAPSSSLTVWDASSSVLTLRIMLIATLIFLPIILAYTSWVYRVLRGPVTSAYIEANRETSY